jgi:hypothetical protein
VDREAFPAAGAAAGAGSRASAFIIQEVVGPL